jgi:flagellar hook-basal body complex protein FliE
MGLLNPAQAYGDIVRLARTDPRHLAGAGAAAGAAPGGSTASTGGPEKAFGEMLLAALGNVNQSQLRGMDLAQAMITDPDSVDVHDVTIALAEANLAISMTKAIVDRALTAYREIINVR